MDNKLYRSFCKNNDVPLFLIDWWLDAVNEEWQSIVVGSEEDNIKAIFPYILKKKLIGNFIGMPKLTPWLGPWIIYPENQKLTSRISYEHDVLQQIVEKLPNFAKFNIHINPYLLNTLSFYWNDFQQNLRITYRFEETEDPDRIYSNFKDNIRREIRKAEKKLEVVETDNINQFLDLNFKTFTRQNKQLPYSEKFVNNLNRSLKERNRRKILFAVDRNRKVYSSVYLVWDKNTVYYLMGGSDPDLRNSGAASLLMWAAIKFASEQKKQFDFEGSMIKPIERFFRSFGARQLPYIKITKVNSRILKIKRSLFNTEN